jgi:hypothetical protein
LCKAISGRLPAPDPSRLKTTRQIVIELVQEMNRFVPRVVGLDSDKRGCQPLEGTLANRKN